jgi:hypothetical protein
MSTKPERELPASPAQLMNTSLRENPASAVQQVFTEKQLADWLGVSAKTLRRQRCQGVGFPYVKFGSGKSASVRYYLPHVLDHLEKCKRVPSVQAAFEMEPSIKKSRRKGL